jgi:RNA ligase
MKLNKTILDQLINDGYILVNQHPTLPLRILNYSRKAQFEKLWNEYTLMCRGMVIDDEYNIIARPFAKFFNYEEHKPEEIPNTNFEVYDKMDGSLGIIFNYADEWHVATRGSFVSDQAIKGRSMLNNYNIEGLNPEMTYLVEIIYPENRIVVDYNGEEKLVLLAVVDVETGYDMPYSVMKYHTGIREINFPLVKHYDGVNDIKELKARNITNQEGYVLRYDNGFRMKVKFEDYCRLHAIITNVSTKDIWEFLRDGKDINELLDRTPDEFDDWVRKQVQLLRNEYLSLESQADLIFSKIFVEGMTKKDFALKALQEDYSAILFKMFEGKPYDNLIWKMIEPEYSKPFFNQDDE